MDIAKLTEDLLGGPGGLLAPRIDLQAFQKRLHEEAALAKAATGKLLVYGLNAKRRSGRERAAKK